MLRHIIGFEIRYWLLSWMLWIFLLIVAAMIFGAASTDQITVGNSLSNTYRNAPYVIENFYAMIGLLTLLMATAFVNSAAARDFSLNTYQMIFSTPLRRRDFLAGRFLGATIVSIIPMLGVSVGILLAKYMPWVEPERWGPVYWGAHLKGIFVFAVPNALFIAAVLFAIAVLARNEIVSFAGALVLLTGYLVTDALVQNIEHERIAAWLDPFAIRTFTLVTKYWTVAEKNTLSAGLSSLLLWNRLLWLGVGAAFFLFACYRFSFAEKRKKARKPETATQVGPSATVSLRAVSFRQAPWAKFLESVRIHFLGIVKSTAFIVILLAALLNTVPSIALNAREWYGNSTLPVTYEILEIIAGTLYMFIVVMITYYAGVLVWKDRDTRMDEITDSLPAPEWISYASRFVALGGMVMLVQLLAQASGVIVQAYNGYHRYQLDLYLKQLILRDGSLFLFLGALAFFIHTLSPNKYVGYFIYVAFLIANVFIWRPLNVATYLVRFGLTPNVTYSDFFGDAPYRTAWNWFTGYWLLFCGLLAVATVMFWPRGRLNGWRERAANASLRFHGAWRLAAGACLLAFAITGAWIFYNTKVLNPLLGPKDLQRIQANYEKSYKRFDKMPQPRVRSLKYAIDVFPQKRNVAMHGEAVIYNPYSRPLEEVHFTLNRLYDASMEIPGASLAKDDQRLSYRIYRFTPPLQPGESRTTTFTVQSKNRGFENAVSTVELVQNGTFFNNTVGPVIGYNPERELTDPNDRRKYGLGEQRLMPALERNCKEDCWENNN